MGHQSKPLNSCYHVIHLLYTDSQCYAKTYLFPSVQGGPFKENLVHLGLSQNPLRDVARHSPGKKLVRFLQKHYDMSLVHCFYASN